MQTFALVTRTKHCLTDMIWNAFNLFECKNDYTVCLAVAKHCYFQSSVTNYLLTLSNTEKKKKYCHTSYVWRLNIVIPNKIMLFVDLLIHCELKPTVIIWGIFCFSYNCLSNFLFTAISVCADWLFLSFPGFLWDWFSGTVYCPDIWNIVSNGILLFWAWNQIPNPTGG